MSALYQALYEVQGKLPGTLKKDATNPHYKNNYITLDGVLETVLPVFREHGLLLIQLFTHLDGTNGPISALETTIVHVESGEKLSSTSPLVLEKENSQGVGSAGTYLKRYAVLSALGLTADEDDDGEAASKSAARSVVKVGSPVGAPGGTQKAW